MKFAEPYDVRSEFKCASCKARRKNEEKVLPGGPPQSIIGEQP
jgi:hypothetical protein